jgi:DNA-binding NtrC family response regulator
MNEPKDINFLHREFAEKPVMQDVRIVLVEDDYLLAGAIKKFLEKKMNLPIYFYKSPMECLQALENDPTFKTASFCLLTDLAFDHSSTDGLLLVDLLKEKKYKFISVLMTGFASIETAIAATKKGAYHYLTKPFELADLARILQAAIVDKLGVEAALLTSQQPADQFPNINIPKRFSLERPTKDDMFQGIIGRSPKMKAVFERIQKVAVSDSTILVTGPSGTGKELVARAIHQLSKRVSNKLISVNCGAIPADLLESELFGHVRGAFTGALTERKGRFELADKGTIFLDEIGDMPLLLQVKLLRVLQNRQIEMVGSSKTIDIDTRIITATHRDLEKAVSDGNFREDLFYRLNVIPIKIPALKERKEDIPLLISYFLDRFVSADGRNGLVLDDSVMELLMRYDWPGNVRELENLIERLVILRGGSTIRLEDLPVKFLEDIEITNDNKPLFELPDDGIDLKRLLGDIEDSLIAQALDRTSGNKNQASKLLQLNRTTLIEKLKKKGILGADLEA